MDPVAPDIYDQLKRRALDEGFAGLGICRPWAIPKAAERLATYIDKERHGNMDWMAQRMHWRGNPATLWPVSAGTHTNWYPYEQSECGFSL